MKRQIYIILKNLRLFIFLSNLFIWIIDYITNNIDSNVCYVNEDINNNNNNNNNHFNHRLFMLYLNFLRQLGLINVGEWRANVLGNCDWDYINNYGHHWWNSNYFIAFIVVGSCFIGLWYIYYNYFIKKKLENLSSNNTSSDTGLKDLDNNIIDDNPIDDL